MAYHSVTKMLEDLGISRGKIFYGDVQRALLWVMWSSQLLGDRIMFLPSLWDLLWIVSY